jgi:hypothetical protein
LAPPRPSADFFNTACHSAEYPATTCRLLLRLIEDTVFGRKPGLASALPLICVLLPAASHAGTLTNAQARHAQRPLQTRPLFEFHNNFWVNLHQTLLEEALLRAGKPDRRLQAATPLAASQMSSLERSDWNAAVTYYATHFGTLRQHGNDQLIGINDTLAMQPDDGGNLSSADLLPGLVAVLADAAPIFRKYWWPAQQQSNTQWIASQRARVVKLGPRLAAAMTRDLRQPWPARPIRVDVCYYVPEIGFAFTILPPHITYASGDPTHQGVIGFELLFHEASHTFADAETDALSRACHARGKDCGDLWHTLLFYTSGVELGRLLPAGERASFTPYADKFGLYTHGAWIRYRRVLATDWQAYLDGKTSFDTAIGAMATHLEQ